MHSPSPMKLVKSVQNSRINSAVEHISLPDISEGHIN